MEFERTGIGAWISELKRRRVFRVVAAYTIVAAGVVAFAADAFPNLGMPNRAVTYVVVLCLIGFPVAIALAWIFDVTTAGVTRTPNRQSWRNLSDNARAGERSHSRKTLAVLPLKVIGQDTDNAVFAEGLTDDIIAQVSKITALSVISRTSAMRFRDSRSTIPRSRWRWEPRPSWMEAYGE